MFCPSCGTEERQAVQFCRACGTDLRLARQIFETPDTVTVAADTAREEIGRAFAAKIREVRTGKDLKLITEEVLPEIEKFLESPAEKRLRAMRVGSTLSLIGLGAAVGFSIVSRITGDDGIFFVAAAGLVTLCIGLAYFLNGCFLTVPKSEIADRSQDGAMQRTLESAAAGESIGNATTNELKLPEARQTFVSSVTDETTRALADKQPVVKK